MQNMGRGRRNFLMRITTTKKNKKNKKCIKNMQKVFTFPMMCTIATCVPILMFPPSSINCPILPNNGCHSCTRCRYASCFPYT
jgi:hypothetical protein